MATDLISTQSVSIATCRNILSLLVDILSVRIENMDSHWLHRYKLLNESDLSINTTRKVTKSTRILSFSTSKRFHLSDLPSMAITIIEHCPWHQPMENGREYQLIQYIYYVI